MKTKKYLRKRYDQDVAYEDARLDKYQLERDITWRMLNDYLPEKGRLLELGAATGRYTIDLARKGHEVTAVDLSGKSLRLAKQRAEEAGVSDKIRFAVCDARDMVALRESVFDAALVMGPLYHITEMEERLYVLKQVSIFLTPTGKVFSAFISRYGIFGELIRENPEWIENQEEVRSILESGLDLTYESGERFRGYYSGIEEIYELHRLAGFEPLTLAATRPAIAADNEGYNRITGRQREMWLDLFYRISTQPQSVAASSHLMFVGQKR